MPEEEGNPFDAAPEGFFGYGNEQEDRTVWLHERVRVQFAEHFSELYDKIPEGVIPIVVQLVMAAMHTAEGGEEDAQGAGT